MEFLDPKKQRAHTIRMLVGYVLIAVAILLATTILIYMARGYGYKNGEIIQNGIVFVSSVPSPADMYINGQKSKDQTNTRLTIPAGQYVFELRREGYRKWQRAINVEGSVVVRFDYPFLFPSKLATSNVKKYDTQPDLTLQSPDRRWLLVPRPGAFGSFDSFDLDGPEKAPALLQLPDEVLSAGDGSQKWELVEWSTDNRHVLLRHWFENNSKSEYMLLDRQDASKTVNLTTTLGTNPSSIALRDKSYDSYFIFDANTGNLFTASLKQPTPELYMEGVLAFKSHGDDRVLYVTGKGAPDGKVFVKQKDGDRTFTLKTLAGGTKYLLDFAQYEGSWYEIISAQSEGRTYVYKDPVESLKSKPEMPLVPVHILKTPMPDYVSFSSNTRFMMAENGASFSVYDAENDRGYKYDLKVPVNSASGHAEWMDGHRMSIVTGGKLHVFEFDNANQVTLQPQGEAYPPAFDRDYKFVYSLAPQASKGADGKETTKFVLTRTALRTADDQ